MEDKLCELKDIVEMIYRYNTVHKDGMFVFRFVGFKKDLNSKCEECGKYDSEYDDRKSLVGAHGSLEDIRLMLNELRDICEDSVDDDGFVGINEFGKDVDEEGE